MKKIQGNDSFQRINYLYQISKVVCDKSPVLSAYYNNLLINVAKKNVLKLHPDLKRQICKKCRCSMVNGVTSEAKVTKKSKKLKCLMWICKVCMNKKTITIHKDRDTRVWSEKPQAIVEVI